MTLSVGIAGYGIVGKRRKLCVDLHPDLKVKAICDKTFENTGFSSEKVLTKELSQTSWNDRHQIRLPAVAGAAALEVVS